MLLSIANLFIIKPWFYKEFLIIRNILQRFQFVSKRTKYDNDPFYRQLTFQQMQTAVSCNVYACVSPTAQQQAIKVKKSKNCAPSWTVLIYLQNIIANIPNVGGVQNKTDIFSI